jgi:hypothetical protein
MSEAPAAPQQPNPDYDPELDDPDDDASEDESAGEIFTYGGNGSE